MSARELYNSAIRPMSPKEKLRLASMILDDLSATGGAGLDLSDDWSDEDLAEVAAFALKHAGATVPIEDSNA